MDTDFIKYDEIVKILNDNGYYGFTVKRIGTKNTRFLYKFVSIKWYTVDITVDVLRLNGEKIVAGIKFNDDDIRGIEDFRRRLKWIGKEHSAKRKKGK